MRPLGSPEALERRRFKAIALLKEGFTPVEVARQLGVDRRSVRRWNAAYRKAGKEGLAAKPASGRPSKLSIEQRKRLRGYLLQGAKAFGHPTDLWTCPRVARLIREQFGVRYHVDHIGRLLRLLGLTPQKPERRARERDERGIRRWVREEWPEVKKTPGA